MNKKERERWKGLLAVEESISYEAHLKETRNIAENELIKTVNRYPLTIGGLIAKQVKFLAWKIWLMQGMALAALCGIFISMYGGMAFQWEWFIARFLCGSGGVIAACAIPVLQRSMRYGMFELECSTRFSVRGGLAAQLLFIGIGDVGMLATLAVLASRCGAGGEVVFLFGVVPFLTAALTGLMIWTRIKTCISVHWLLAICVGAVLSAYEALMLISRLFPAYTMGFGIFYALLCIGMIGRLYHKILLRERGRQLLWKFY